MRSLFERNMSTLPAGLGGKTVLVTGAASGLGYETALRLASSGARVLIADRNVVGGREAERRLRAASDDTAARFLPLDLADLSAIATFADRLLAEEPVLDLLINNAGLLPPLRRRTTIDGFELGMGVSFIGHYALTGHLLPALLRAPGAARVVTVSSVAHGSARLNPDDLDAQRRYDPSQAYADAKLACLLFAQELQRHAQSGGFALQSVAAHPGIARTPIARSWDGQSPRGLRDRVAAWALWSSMHALGQSAAAGADSIVYAATQTDVDGGAFYGPGGFGQFSGAPRRVQPKKPAREAGLARRLWSVAETRTGVVYVWPGR